jgi:PhnB protein
MTTARPYLTVHDARAAIAFYSRAFGAEVTELHDYGDSIGHATLHIGDAVIYLSDEFPDYRALSPQSLGGCSAAVVLGVDDPDAVFVEAVDAGADGYRPVKDDPGGRSGWVVDPFGHRWNLRTAAAESTDA